MRRTSSWFERILASFSPSARRWTAIPFRPHVEPLECRRVPATLLVSPSGLFGGTPTLFTAIQPAVDAAAPGDTILVGAGTYAEQVLITKDGLDLASSAAWAAVIQAPTNDVLAVSAAIVDIQGAANVVVDGFTIMGPGPGAIPFAGLCFGVYVENSSSAMIQNNHITRIADDPDPTTDAPAPLSPSGVGIEVGLSAGGAGALGLASTIGSAQVLNNTVDSYQQSGIVVDNAGSSANVQGNVVTGLASDVLVQNGIEVRNGAVSVVQGNTVTGNLFGVSHAAESAGILLDNPGPGVAVLNNTVVFNDAGIVVRGAVNPILSGNSISLSLFDGIRLESGTTGAQVTFNVSTENGWNGIFVNADVNTIADNTTVFNSEDGIQLLQASGNPVQGNTVFENARDGISQFLSAGQSNTVDGNTVYGNGQGDLFFVV